MRGEKSRVRSKGVVGGVIANNMRWMKLPRAERSQIETQNMAGHKRVVQAAPTPAETEDAA